MPSIKHFTWKLCLAGSLLSRHGFAKLLDCSVAASMRGEPYQDIAYALGNVSCPPNYGSTQLLTNNNLSSVLTTSQAILITLRDSITYLNSTQPMVSASGQTYFVGPVHDVEYNFEQWVSQLVLHKKSLFDGGIGSSLPDQLSQQKGNLSNFIDAVVTKVYTSLQQDVKDVATPALAYLDCGIKAFASSDSPISTCSPLPSSLSAGPSPTPTTTLNSATATSSRPSATGTGSAVTASEISMTFMVAGLLIACI